MLMSMCASNENHVGSNLVEYWHSCWHPSYGFQNCQLVTLKTYFLCVRLSYLISRLESRISLNSYRHPPYGFQDCRTCYFKGLSCSLGWSYLISRLNPFKDTSTSFLKNTKFSLKISNLSQFSTSFIFTRFIKKEMTNFPNKFWGTPLYHIVLRFITYWFVWKNRVSFFINWSDILGRI